jgi:acetoin utilization protein AcuC
MAIVAGEPLEPRTEVPRGWRSHVLTRLGRQGPFRMTDGRSPVYRDWTEGYDPNTWLDRAINATRSAVFPLHGLDPLP